VRCRISLTDEIGKTTPRTPNRKLRNERPESDISKDVYICLSKQVITCKYSS